MKYRNDHLENYQGHGLEHSASDYHYHKLPPAPKISSRQLQAKGRGHMRNRSQFSILSEDDPRACESYYQDPVASETVESYDPFRPSLNPITDTKAEYANVTVLRGQPSSASRHRPGSVRYPVAPRVQALQYSHRVGSGASIASSGGNSKRRISARQYGSRSSLASSSHRGSSPIFIRPSDHHKRNISFSQSGKNSLVSPLRGRYNKGQKLTSLNSGYVPEDSPAPDAIPIPKISQRNSNKAVPTPHEGRRTASHIWREEARQVSSELERFCDEAFNRDEAVNRSSIASTAHTRNTSRLTIANELSPVSSFTSREEPLITAAKISRTRDRARPMPAPPRTIVDAKGNVEYENSLAEGQQSQLAKPGPNGYLEDVIAHLDRLIKPGEVTQVERDERRIVSATPDCRSPDGAGYLPVISEEGRYSDADELQALLNQGDTGYRSASAPLQDGPYMSCGNGRILNKNSAQTTREGRDTIRIVHRDSANPIPVEPLNIRKKITLRSDLDPSARRKPGQSNVLKPQEHVRLSSGDPDNPDNWANKGDGDPRARGSRTESSDGRMKDWFKRRTSNSDDEVRPMPPPKDNWSLPPLGCVEAANPKAQPTVGPTKRFPHNHNPSWSGTKGFFKMFKRGLRKQDAEMAFGGKLIVLFKPLLLG
jgi:serine/threonine-protein kinase HSL1, negative regulator of Swe1 kinase